MDAFFSQDDDSIPYDASGSWGAACVASLLSRHGVPPRPQAPATAQIWGISVSQPRRKLRGAVWLLNEVLALCRHHGESLEAVFGTEHGPGAPGQAGVLLIDGLELPCQVRAGAICPPTSSEAALLTTRVGERWLVGTPARLDAYVLDLVLSGGQTPQAKVERIRRQQPDAPIVLLTGQLRDGKASESTLAALLRTHRVTFFEKPVRPVMITAAIQNGLDQLKPAA